MSLSRRLAWRLRMRLPDVQPIATSGHQTRSLADLPHCLHRKIIGAFSMVKPVKRVLHIGNVANYGYNIGKLLQQEGLQSHTINWDYYHINAQPMWEEGRLDPSGVGDHFFPKLPSALDAGFANPVWYVQGPRELACLTLIAMNERKAVRAAVFRWLLNRHLARIHDRAYRENSAPRDARILAFAFKVALGGFGTSAKLSGVLRVVLNRFTGFSTAKLLPPFGGALFSRLRVSSVRHALGVKWKVLNALDAIRSLARRIVRKALRHAGITIGAPRTVPILPSSPTPSSIAPTADPAFAAEGEAVAAASRHTTFEALVQSLIRQYQTVHPDRSFDPMLLMQYQHTLPIMSRLFRHYDLIIGYAIEGIWPLVAGFPYVAYEFGTIRNLPFEDTATGRLAYLTYRNCEQIIVTNCDNEAPAKRLARPYFFLPHVVNESGRLDDRETENARSAFIAEHGGRFVVFHPSRQHWDEQRDTNWDKGNDHLFRGFARLVKNEAPEARCIAVAWGQSLERSKALIAELGIEENIVWISPQPHIAMMRYICLSDVVCDQFTIPTFGGIPPKAFHAGKPVITSFDPGLHHWCFDSLPPILSADTPDAVHAALAMLHGDPLKAREIGEAGERWYVKENSNARVRQVLLSRLSGLKETSRTEPDAHIGKSIVQSK
jgi:glycosyltransferase involved in cell wall biosynthesis